MLWDAIFEFYIKYIFGGVLNGVVYTTSFGSSYLGNTLIYGDSTSVLNGVTISSWNGNAYTIPMPNYFSLIATIITIVIIVIACWLFVYKIIKLIGGLIR